MVCSIMSSYRDGGHAMSQVVICRMSLQRSVFNPRQVNVGFVVEKVALDRLLFTFFAFPLSLSFQHCRTLIILSLTLHNLS
jgi:hypothetical protein